MVAVLLDPLLERSAERNLSTAGMREREECS
jgi:hypothetical protein